MSAGMCRACGVGDHLQELGGRESCPCPWHLWHQKLPLAPSVAVGLQQCFL